MPIIIRIGQRASLHVPSTPLTVGLVGTSIQDSGESAPDYGTFYDIPSVAEAEARFGTGVSARREGSIVEAVKLIDLHRLPPIKAAAVDVSTGLHQAAVRTAINSTVDAMPTEVTLLAAPGLTVNYDASGDSLTTVCSTVARLQARAVAARGIAITDTAFDTVANAIIVSRRRWQYGFARHADGAPSGRRVRDSASRQLLRDRRDTAPYRRARRSGELERHPRRRRHPSGSGGFADGWGCQFRRR